MNFNKRTKEASGDVLLLDHSAAAASGAATDFVRICQSSKSLPLARLRLMEGPHPPLIVVQKRLGNKQSGEAEAGDIARASNDSDQATMAVQVLLSEQQKWRCTQSQQGCSLHMGGICLNSKYLELGLEPTRQGHEVHWTLHHKQKRCPSNPRSCCAWPSQQQLGSSPH